MPLSVAPELLEKISACAELGNTIDQAATVLQVSAEDLVELLRDNAEARAIILSNCRVLEIALFLHHIICE